MAELIDSLRTWATSDFESTLKRELKQLGAGALPLAAATNQGGLVDAGSLGITVFRYWADERWLFAECGIIFREIVGGCSCGDDPVPENAFCRLRVRIDRMGGSAEFSILPDPI